MPLAVGAIAAICHRFGSTATVVTVASDAHTRLFWCGMMKEEGRHSAKKGQLLRCTVHGVHASCGILYQTKRYSASQADCTSEHALALPCEAAGCHLPGTSQLPQSTASGLLAPAP
jgi:hypothetical protein